MIDKKFINVPNKPGVYLWKDQYQKIIYIGKAKNLQARLKQYFQGQYHSYKIPKLVSEIKSYELFITNNEQEALILERNLIQKYMPIYNTKLLDHKKFPYLKIALLNHDLKIQLVFNKSKNSYQQEFYFGPLPKGFGAKHLLRYLVRNYQYQDGLPIKGEKSIVLEAKFKEIKNILLRDSHQIINKLEAKMWFFAKELNFELAHDLKNVVFSLRAIQNKQNIVLPKIKNIDVWAFYQKDNYVSITIVFYRAKMLLSKQNFIIEIKISLMDTIRQFVALYYQNHPQPEVLFSNLLFETNWNLEIPIKGNKKAIVNIAIQNAEYMMSVKLEEIKIKDAQTSFILKGIAQLINHDHLENIIMIDNSNTMNEMPISAIIHYRNGYKYYSGYRKYQIKSKVMGDVYYTIYGLQKYFQEKGYQEPNLIILDGGIQHMAIFKKSFPDYQNKVISLVKNEKHQTSHIIDQDFKKIMINNQQVFNFFSKIQKEVDLYAKHYHRKKRLNSLNNTLANVKGIGPKTEAKLLTYFKNYNAIYNATIEELLKFVSLKVAQEIKKQWG